MNVLFVTFHCCVRAFKSAMGVLAYDGTRVHTMAARCSNTTFQLGLPGITYYIADPENLKYSLQAVRDHYGPFDVVHVHNEPNWPVLAVRDVFADTPLVLDCHDLDSMRRGGTALPPEGAQGAWEREAIAAADALVFPSHAYQERTAALYGLTKPARVVYSAVPTGMIGMQQLPRIGGLVYQGGLADVSVIYRDYRHMFATLSRAEVPVHCYPTGLSPELVEHYGAAGAVVMPTVSYATLLMQLSRYDAGLVGGPVDHPQWHMAMPNKLFDYLAAGIPVIVHKADECARFVREHNVGVVVDTVRDIPDAMQAINAYRPFVEAFHDAVCAESEGAKIMNLYAGLAGGTDA